MKVRSCPVCGHKRTWLLREIGSKKKPFHIECIYCHFATDSARTMAGACRKWNKESKNVKGEPPEKENQL